MKVINKLLLFQALFFACSIFAKQEKRSAAEASKKWKIIFFKEYMKGYDSLDEPNHKNISQVLQKSFKKSEEFIPEEDADLAAGVRNQVKFFVSLKDSAAIEREVKKCKDGMKEAHSVWAKMASDGTKSRKFVSRFYKEYEKRKKGGKKRG